MSDGFHALAQFHFLRPAWLLVLIAAVWLPWAVRRQRDVRRRWRGTIAPHLLDALVVREGRHRPVRPVHMTALALALGAIALAGPTWERERPPFLSDKAPLAIAVDLTPDMDAIDVTPTRLERAKLKIKALLAHRDGGRTALYAYAGSTHPVLPLTDDAALLQTFVDALQTAIMPVPGKDTARAVQTIGAALSKEPVPGTILLLTDGVEPAATTALRQRDPRTQIVVLAIGTAAGGPLKAGNGAAPGLDAAALHRLRDTGVPVATLTSDSDDDVAWVQRHVQSHVEQGSAQDTLRWHDAGWPLTIPIAVLALLWFRKGWTIRWMASLTLAALVAAPPADVRAQSSPPARGWHFVDLWLTHDQQGRRAFARGDYAAAATLFDDPMWRGVAYYRAGKFNDAARAFEQIGTPDAQYNLGNALARQNKYPEAAARYRLVLQQRPGWAPAQRNLALMQQAIERQKQAEKNDKGDEEPPDLKPDKIELDPSKPPPPPGGDRMQQGLVQQNADMWMRAIQTSPTMLLARKFALQAQAPETRP
ncbi:Ca-activated chloride channel family protein [Ralstonia sp. 25mfcol4.1]|uniref:vWA domain-containing protein n=1 Tax=Burkholderiaceae TaxID=119060 RepID=UPI00088D4221|nr:VWA domain-containing protein [Ralstonia sp. 25mfcol4.1]SDP49754.1 Ca-activated chloride channel family protein [Ralstonia sp. 25mfcol4.1]